MNTHQYYVLSNKNDLNERWINRNILATLNKGTKDKTSIEEWMQEEKTTDLQKWFGCDKGQTIIKGWANTDNPDNCIEEAVWISAGFVEIDVWDSFVNSINSYFERREDLIEVDSFQSYLNCWCYGSPEEAVLSYPEWEYEKSRFLNNDEKTIEIYTTAVECNYTDDFNTEYRYLVPNQLLRKITGITYSDGFISTNDEGNVISEFYKVGEDWGTQQEWLMINSNKLYAGLEKNNMKLFWLYRVRKNPNSKAYERYKNILHHTDHTYLVWREDDIVKHMELKDVQRPIEHHNEVVYKRMIDELYK